MYIGIYATSQRQTLHIAHEKRQVRMKQWFKNLEMGKPTCERKSLGKRKRERGSSTNSSVCPLKK